MNTQAISGRTAPSTITVSRSRRRQKAELAALHTEHSRLMLELLRAQQSLNTALNNFDHLRDSKALDVCIYQMQTAQSQYDNILRRIRPVCTRIRELDGSV